MRPILTFTLLVSLLVACGQKDDHAAVTNAPAAQQPAVAQTSLTPEQLGELGAQINRQPDHAAELLTHHGLTEESFEKEIRKITEDPQASRRYANAYKRARA